MGPHAHTPSKICEFSSYGCYALCDCHVLIRKILLQKNVLPSYKTPPATPTAPPPSSKHQPPLHQYTTRPHPKHYTRPSLHPNTPCHSLKYPTTLHSHSPRTSTQAPLVPPPKHQPALHPNMTHTTNNTLHLVLHPSPTHAPSARPSRHHLLLHQNTKHPFTKTPPASSPKLFPNLH